TCMSPPASMPLDLATAFPGLCNALASRPQTDFEQDDITDDVAAEQETLTGNTSITGELAQLQDTLKHVSKGISDSTELEYNRLIAHCDSFLRAHEFLQDSESLFSRCPRKETPSLIIAWIMDA
ncbi:hypothetical protein DFH29DRAFT_792060, partial [Suillus ampliporus]